MQSPNSDQKKEPVTPSTDQPVIPANDRVNIVIIFVLYLLQGIPRGLCMAIPLILQKRKVSYEEQAIYDIVSLPGTFKLLWAPIVDCVYSARIGKRKTWLVPTQLLTGFCLLYASFNVEEWLGSEDLVKRPKILPLAILFFLTNILLATQDIATDGWALTMLSRENIGYQGFCNAMGVRAGVLLGYVVYILFNSADFCNTWLRKIPQPYGMLSLEDYMFFWSITLIIVTILILFFKKDNSLEVLDGDPEAHVGILSSYKFIYNILRIKPFLILCYVLLFCRVCLGPMFGVTNLKLIEYGLTPDKLVLISIPMIPVQSLLPLCLKRCFLSKGSLERYARTIEAVMVVSILLALFVYFTPMIKQKDGFPMYFYALYFGINAIEHMVLFLMHTTFLAFAASISDLSFGGTYLTLIGTVSELGVKWTVVLSLWMVEKITLKSCHIPTPSYETLEVTPPRMACKTILDGYYIEVFVSITFTFLWLQLGGKRIMIKLQDVPQSEWRVKQKKTPTAPTAVELSIVA